MLPLLCHSSSASGTCFRVFLFLGRYVYYTSSLSFYISVFLSRDILYVTSIDIKNVVTIAEMPSIIHKISYVSGSVLKRGNKDITKQCPIIFMIVVTLIFFSKWLQQIPIWWRWYYWASPVAWTLYGLVTSQVGDKSTDLELPGLGTSIPVKTFLKDSLDFDYDFLPAVAVAHVGWVLLFFFVFAYGIKFLNFQRR